MKLNKSKKGFTLVELVIVIAVIGILAAVLIPTFSGVIESANKAAAQQAVSNAQSMYVVAAAGEGEVAEVTLGTYNGYYVVIATGEATKGEVPAGYTALSELPTDFALPEGVVLYTGTASGS